MSVAATDNFSLELGYTYSEYGVNVLSSNPLIQTIQAQSYYSGSSMDSMTMKQNVIDLNAKLYLVGSDSRIRPFVGLGGGYGLSYINYSSQILNYINQMGYQQALGSDYSLNSVLGDLAAGMDVKVAKNIAVGVVFKYYRVFSSSESNNIFNSGYVNYNTPNINTDKQFVSDNLSNASFYSALAGVSFTF